MIRGSHVEGAGSSMQGAGNLGSGMQAPPEEQQYGKVSVWWDLENCPVPIHTSDPWKIICNIINALKGLGYHGHIEVHGYGNTDVLCPQVQNALNSTGVLLIHVPSGGDDTNMKMIANMMFWGYDNPAPASYLLISGDEDFIHVLKTLKKQHYNIMLAGRSFPYDTHLADIVWDWDSILGGLPRQIV